MEERELTFTDIWYRYIVPFFIGIGRSIKRTICSKRIIAVILLMVLVPVAAFTIFKLTKKEADKLYFNASSYTVEIDKEKLDVSIDNNGNNLVSKQSFALKVAEEQAKVIAEVIKSEQFLKLLYNDEIVVNSCKCLTEGLSSSFNELYIGDKVDGNGKITEAYFYWAIKNYICVDVNESGMFSVNVVNNIPVWYNYKIATMKENNKIELTKYNNAIKEYKSYPILDSALISAVGSIMENIVPNELYDYMFSVRKVDCMTGISKVAVNATQTLSEGTFVSNTSFRVSNWVGYAALGLGIGFLFFLLIDMCRAIGGGLKRYKEKNA